jgi:methylenetetrahydrofolate dehydrogenase (NADP+) / methenyltetrahydrofolate cyclohydrolase
MAQIIDGKAIAKRIKAEVKERIAARGEPAPLVVAVEVGEDAASASYVRNQARQAERVGIHHRLDRLPADTNDEALRDHLRGLNADPAVTGIMLQTPLPRHLDLRGARALIASSKDVEAVGPLAAGALVANTHAVAPCTAQAAVLCLEDVLGDDLSGKHVVVIGRSEIVGRPLGLLLLHANATVTVCHRHTGDLSPYTRNADAVVVAVGKPGLVRGDMVRPGAVVVDVGTNWIEAEERLVGDVDFDSVEPHAAAITPVPGGVGPVTVAVLLANTLHLAEAASPASPEAAQ